MAYRKLNKSLLGVVAVFASVLPVQEGQVALAGPAPQALGVVTEPAPPFVETPRATARVVAAPLPLTAVHLSGARRVLNNHDALNPTGGPVRRNDAWGSGEYRATRYDRDKRRRYRHNGVDFVGKVKAPVVAPISGELRRIGRGATTGVVIVGRINGKRHVVKLLHFDPAVSNGAVLQGQFIGRVKNLKRWYPGMTPHVHMDVHEWRGDSLLKEKHPLHLVRSY